jgi:hypothetical protein
MHLRIYKILQILNLYLSLSNFSGCGCWSISTFVIFWWKKIEKHIRDPRCQYENKVCVCEFVCVCVRVCEIGMF